jgi:hypothetical protein
VRAIVHVLADDLSGVGSGVHFDGADTRALDELFAPEMRDEPAQLAAAIAALKKSEHSQE